jgi:hypothetical protein
MGEVQSQWTGTTSNGLRCFPGYFQGLTEKTAPRVSHYRKYRLRAARLPFTRITTLPAVRHLSNSMFGNESWNKNIPVEFGLWNLGSLSSKIHWVPDINTSLMPSAWNPGRHLLELLVSPSRQVRCFLAAVAHADPCFSLSSPESVIGMRFPLVDAQDSRHSPIPWFVTLPRPVKPNRSWTHDRVNTTWASAIW